MADGTCSVKRNDKCDACEDGFILDTTGTCNTPTRDCNGGTPVAKQGIVKCDCARLIDGGDQLYLNFMMDYNCQVCPPECPDCTSQTVNNYFTDQCIPMMKCNACPMSTATPSTFMLMLPYEIGCVEKCNFEQGLIEVNGVCECKEGHEFSVLEQKCKMVLNCVPDVRRASCLLFDDYDTCFKIDCYEQEGCLNKQCVYGMRNKQGKELCDACDYGYTRIPGIENCVRTEECYDTYRGKRVARRDSNGKFIEFACGKSSILIILRML